MLKSDICCSKNKKDIELGTEYMLQLIYIVVPPDSIKINYYKKNQPISGWLMDQDYNKLIATNSKK